MVLEKAPADSLRRAAIWPKRKGISAPGISRFGQIAAANPSRPRHTAEAARGHLPRPAVTTAVAYRVCAGRTCSTRMKALRHRFRADSAAGDKAVACRRKCRHPPPDCHRIVIRLRCGVKARCTAHEHRRRCLVNVHANRPLTPALRRRSQQSVRWGTHKNRSRRWPCPHRQSSGYLTSPAQPDTRSELRLSSSRSGVHDLLSSRSHDRLAFLLRFVIMPTAKPATRRGMSQ